MNIKNLLGLSVFSVLLFVGCSEEENMAPVPSNISDVSVEPRVGGATIFWKIPSDSNYLYVEARYQKKGEIAKHLASVYTDSLVIEGLLSKYEYQFEVQPFNDDQVGSDILITEKVTPIRRPLDITYSINDAVKVELSADMIDTYTQESSEGPKENLLDDDINTFWHSAWSSGVAPLPHYIQINFGEPTKIGAARYTLRQGGNASHHPNKFDLQVSEDGVEWETVWVSDEDLATSPEDAIFTLDFNKNYESLYFRIRVLETPANGTFTYLSGIEVLTLGESIVDLEKEAEERY